MNLRDALINQSPSLALQRAAADEIARQDAQLEAWAALYAATLRRPSTLLLLLTHEEQAREDRYQAALAKVQQLCL